MLMGDMLLSDAYQMFARVPLPEPVRLSVLDLLDHAITESIVGEHLDVALGDRVTPPTLETVLTMTRLKTATYTFQLPLRAAAILAGSGQGVEDAVGDVGARLGSAFQLQDDLLSTFGESSEHGKDAFSDLREGKETAIIAFARTTDTWRKIEPLFGDRDLSVAEALTIRELLRECGAEAFARSLVAAQIHGAQTVMDGSASPLPPELVTFVRWVMSTLEERRS